MWTIAGGIILAVVLIVAGLIVLNLAIFGVGIVGGLLAMVFRWLSASDTAVKQRRKCPPQEQIKQTYIRGVTPR